MRFDAHEGKHMFNKRLTPVALQPAARGQKKSRG